MTDLVRAGVVAAVLGATLATLWAVAFGAVAASTEVGCPDGPREFTVSAVDPATLTLWVGDGCNDRQVARPVVGGLAVAGVGAVVGGAGLARRAAGGG